MGQFLGRETDIIDYGQEILYALLQYLHTLHKVPCPAMIFVGLISIELLAINLEEVGVS